MNYTTGIYKIKATTKPAILTINTNTEIEIPIGTQTLGYVANENYARLFMTDKNGESIANVKLESPPESIDAAIFRACNVKNIRKFNNLETL